jgi:hypothetical protein
LKINKLDIERYELDYSRFEGRLNDFDKFHRENHVHYIQVENYLEKYLPMKIQKAIGKNIKAIFEDRKGVVEKYLSFEENFLKEANKTILLDDG